MTNLHPLMQTALDSAMAANLAAIRLFNAPPCPRGMIEYEWHTDLSVPVICHIEYEPAERGAREDGQQMSPDWPESFHLVAAYVRDINIYELLSAKQLSAIEDAAADGQHESREDAKVAADEARRESEE